MDIGNLIKHISGVPKNKNIGLIYVMYEEYDLLEEEVRRLNFQTKNDFDFIVISGYKSDSNKILNILNLLKTNSILLQRKQNNGPSGGFFIGQNYILENRYKKCINIESDCFPECNDLIEKIENKLETEDVVFPGHKDSPRDHGMWRFSGFTISALEMVGTVPKWIFIVAEDQWQHNIIKILSNAGILKYHVMIGELIEHIGDPRFLRDCFDSSAFMNFPYLRIRNEILVRIGSMFYAFKQAFKKIGIKSPKLYFQIIKEIFKQFVAIGYSIFFCFIPMLFILFQYDRESFTRAISGLKHATLLNIKETDVFNPKPFSIAVKIVLPKNDNQSKLKSIYQDTFITFFSQGNISANNKLNPILKLLLTKNSYIYNVGNNNYLVKSEKKKYEFIILYYVLCILILPLYPIYYIFMLFRVAINLGKIIG